MSKIDAHNFIRPGEDVQKNDPEWEAAANLTKEELHRRWQTETGRALQERLRASRLERRNLEQAVGRFGGQLDLRGIDLSGLDLSGWDLSGIDFFAANLSRTNFSGANLSGSYLSETDIRGADFSWAQMDRVLIDNVNFDPETRFLGVDLNRMNFTLAELLREQAVLQQRIAHLEKRYPRMARLLWLISNYGQSLSRFLVSCLVVILGFAGLFWLWLGLSPLAALNMSVMAFLGIAVPNELTGMVALVEAAIGYFMLALLAAILVRKTMGPIV